MITRDVPDAVPIAWPGIPYHISVSLCSNLGTQTNYGSIFLRLHSDTTDYRPITSIVLVRASRLLSLAGHHGNVCANVAVLGCTVCNPGMS